jgi:hypothetical protein
MMLGRPEGGNGGEGIVGVKGKKMREESLQRRKESRRKKARMRWRRKVRK